MKGRKKKAKPKPKTKHVIGYCPACNVIHWTWSTSLEKSLSGARRG